MSCLWQMYANNLERTKHRKFYCTNSSDGAYTLEMSLLIFFSSLQSRTTEGKYRVFIKYCVFKKIFKFILDSGLSRFPLGVSVCTQWQVEHQRCSRTGRVQKNHNIVRKNTIFNEHPVCRDGAF